jgi:16S rRNA (guanine527-N7)-methyltransferase
MQRVGDILVRGAEQIGLTVNSHEVESFLFHITELKKWNKKINLTSLEDDVEIGAKHFLDSLTVAPYVHGKQRVLDIGTGAGFPSLPLKIISPTMELVLLESSQKKVFFLRHIVRGLKLEGVAIIHARAEDREIKERYARSFDLVLARALADLPTSLRLALPYIKRGGCVVGMRGKKGEEEIHEVDLDALGLRLIEMRKLTLPFVEESRVLLLLELTKTQFR